MEIRVHRVLGRAENRARNHATDNENTVKNWGMEGNQ